MNAHASIRMSPVKPEPMMNTLMKDGSTRGVRKTIKNLATLGLPISMTANDLINQFMKNLFFKKKYMTNNN